MYRPAFRATAAVAAPLKSVPRANAARRFLSTAPPHQKSRSWKSSAVRWGLAGALVYYYNTSTVFAEEPAYIHDPPEASRDSEAHPTVSSVAEQRREQLRKSYQSQQQKQGDAQSVAVADIEDAAAPPGSPEALEEEADQQGAFNEETGEINWDCPCLGGMAYGPCGEQFRNAFSCFVYSKEEPKGVDCIENFKAMQNCFREHPDIYGSELEDDEGAEAGQAEGQGEPVSAQAQAPSPSESSAAAGEAPGKPHTGTSAASQQVKSDQ